MPSINFRLILSGAKRSRRTRDALATLQKQPAPFDFARGEDTELAVVLRGAGMERRIGVRRVARRIENISENQRGDRLGAAVLINALGLRRLKRQRPASPRYRPHRARRP